MKFNSGFAATLSTVAVTTTLGLLASPASAGVFTLGSSSGTWSNPVGGVITNINVPGDTGNEIRWGVPNGARSGLGFDGVGATMFDPGDIFKVGTLSHINQTIPNGTAPTAVDLGITLNFIDPNGLNQVFDFTLAVNETPNIPANCPTDPTACDDIISFPNALPSTIFSSMGMNFKLELIGFADTSEGPFENEFISPEGTTSDTMLFAKVTKIGVPEPATIGGLGLLGVYFLGRRRNQKKNS